MTDTTTTYSIYDSPVGRLTINGNSDVVQGITFSQGSRACFPQSNWRRDDAHYKMAISQLKAYFAGDLKTFEFAFDLAGTSFQNSVWKTLLNIPYGETNTYSQIAALIGKPKAVRAVGAANGANPLPIIVPCHRVIGRSGSLTGFGGGLPAKLFLLELEAANSEGQSSHRI